MIERNDQRPAADVILDHVAALESDLLALRSEADEASRLATLGLLTATLAHELRNVLTPVLSYAQIAQAQPDRPDLVRKALDRTVDGVKAAAEILESTLEFGAASGENASRTSANVREVLESSLKCLARDPSRDGVRIEIAVPDHLAAQIRPLALQQVFMNLLLNAIKAMKSASGAARRAAEHSVTVNAEALADGRVRIRVTDTGPGFSRELAERMFAPFVTTAGDPGRPSEGSGLGLAVCKRLISEAGGSIAAHSIPGEGATFEIQLNQPGSALRKAG